MDFFSTIGQQTPFLLVHLVWFYGISTIVGYLMPNLILNIDQIYDL